MSYCVFKVKESLHIICLLLGLYCILGIGSEAHAREELRSSSDNEIVFAFHKLAGKLPPIDEMAEDTQAFKDAPRAGKKIVLDKQKRILIRQFETYDPEQEFIIIKIPVSVYFEHDHPAGMHLGFQNPENVYFPYTVGDMDFALIPHGINKFKHIPLSQEQTRKMEDIVDDNQVILVMRMKPVRADGSAPMTIGGNEYWLLMGNLTTLDIQDSREQTLWQYRHPSYQEEKKQLGEDDVFWLHQR